MLDIRTLILILVLMRLLQAASLYYVWKIHADYEPPRDWARGSLLLAVGALLVGLRDFIPADVSIIFGNLGIIAGALIFDAGVIRAFGRRPPMRLGWTVFVIFALLLLWLTIAAPSFTGRLILFSAAGALYDITCAVIGFRVPPSPLRGTQRLVAGLIAIEATVGIGRCVDLISHDADHVLAATPVQALFMIVTIAQTFLAAIALTNLTSQRLRIKLDHAAQHDSLTGVLNRRAFNEQVAREWSRATRHRASLSAIMLDLDHFKRLNDDHGHAAGDAALISVASLIAFRLRREDLLCRFGGEEFVVFLPQTSADQAEQLAERLRIEIAQTPVAYADTTLEVTVSIGVAERRDADESWEQVMVLADKALYRAKSEGRNRVVVFGQQRPAFETGAAAAEAYNPGPALG